MTDRLFRFTMLTCLAVATLSSVYFDHAGPAALFGMLFGTALERVICAPERS